MKWGIETLVRIIFKTALLFLFFYAGYLVNEKIKEAREYNHWRKELKQKKDMSDNERGGYVGTDTLRSDTAMIDSLKKIYR